MTLEPPVTPPAGWYVDPELGIDQRWWTGVAWSAHIRPEPTAEPEAAPAGAVDEDAMRPVAPRLPPAEQAPPSRARWGMGSIVSLALTVCLFVALAVVLSPYWLLLPVGAFAVMWFSTDRASLLRSVKARAADPQRDAEILAAVAESARTMGVRMPEVVISPQPVRNAFALTDSRGGMVCVFQGAIDALDDDELSAVLAHEVGHLKNRDSIYMAIFESVRISLTVVMVVFALLVALCAAMLTRGRGVGLGAVFGGGLVLVGAAVAYVLLAVGQRSREYGADRLAAQTHHDPMALGRALEKLAEEPAGWQVGDVPVRIAALCIVPPFASSFLSGIVASHPSTQRRVDRIAKLLGQERVAELESRKTRALAVLEEDRARDAVEFEARIEAVAIGDDVPLRPSPGELIWHRSPARLAASASIDGRRGFDVGERGELLITTERVVFVALTQRVEWRWQQLNSLTWTGPVDGGELAIFAVTDRRRNSGVWVATDDVQKCRLVLERARVMSGAGQDAVAVPPSA